MAACGNGFEDLDAPRGQILGDLIGINDWNYDLCQFYLETTRMQEPIMQRLSAMLATSSMLAIGGAGLAIAGAGHGAGEGHGQAAMPVPENMDEMREMHKTHEHGHDFEAMEEMSATQMVRVMSLMNDIGIATPPMDAERGRVLFNERGCVACHAVNGVGGDLGPSLDAAELARPMNAFEFAARMWRGAQAMTTLQEDLLGEVIALDGQDLADLIAFAHDENEQAKMSEDQIPEKFRAFITE